MNKLSFRELFLFLISLAPLLGISSPAHAAGLVLNRQVNIVVSADVDAPVKKAVTALQADFQLMMNFRPQVVTSPSGDRLQIVVVQGDKDVSLLPSEGYPALDGWESHRVFADADHNRIYLYGYDMRGTIYAIYTFSEEVLGVPPYYYYCSFNPVKRQEIAVPSSLDIFYPTPDVRYRTWFPNDQDLWNPFQNSEERKGKLLETLLRMKMNTIEHGSCVDMKNKTLNADARRMRDYGVVLTNHHMIFLNNDWGNWDNYWRDIRGYSTPPARSTKNFEQMKEFFAYSIDCTLNSNVECLWQIACRGINDHPFWEYIDDSPSSSSERGAFITKVVNAQYDLIKQKTGEQDPFVRMTFYNEVSDFLAQGYVQPPVASNMLWTYVAARRNHYPAADLQKHDKDVKLGYYFNFQFTSTGSHLAPAEGPWKMEDNYRYLRSKGPVTFSVVNMGNFREYWFDAIGYTPYMLKTMQSDAGEFDQTVAWNKQSSMWRDQTRSFIRLSEVYLCYAEALGRSGQVNQEAIDLVNIVRNRADGQGVSTSRADGSANVYPNSLTAAQLAEAAYNEHGWEAACYHYGYACRYFDMRRMERVKEHFEYRKQNPAIEVTGQWLLENPDKADMVTGPVSLKEPGEIAVEWSEKLLYFPYPAYDKALNDKLKDPDAVTVQ